MGVASEVLTSSVLSRAYDIDVRVTNVDGRYFAAASGRW
jgi:ABC-type cobalamin transport system ATPase subunit